MKKGLFLVVCISLFLISCEVFNGKNNLLKAQDIWVILDEAAYIPWTKEMLEKILGKPDNIHKKQDDGQDKETWIYNHKVARWQQWAFGIGLDNKVTGVLYKPSGDGFDEFTMDAILERWKKYNCKKIENEVLRGHTYNLDRSYSCDGNRSFGYNRYNEVSSVTVAR